MADKEIKFKFVVDDASFAKGKRALTELISEAQKLAQVLKGVNLGGMLGAPGTNPNGLLGGGGVTAGGSKPGGGPAGPTVKAPSALAAPLVDIFSKHRDAFKGLTEGSKDSLKIMTAGLKEAVSTQRRELSDLDKTISSLNTSYERLGRTADRLRASGSSDPAAAAQLKSVEGKRAEFLNQGVQASADRAENIKKINEMKAIGAERGIAPGLIDPGAPGGGGGGFGQMLTKGRGMPGWLKGAARAGGLALAGADAVYGETLAENGQGVGTEARRAQLVEGQIRRLQGGDIKGLLAAQMMDGDRRREMLAQSAGSLGTATVTKDALGQAFTGLPVVKQVAGMFGGGGGAPGGIMGGFGDAAQSTARAELAQAFMRNQEQAQVRTNIAFDTYNQSIGGRIQAQRLLGIGGLGERTKVRHKDGSVGYDLNRYGTLDSELTAQGYDVGGLAGARAGLLGGTGSRFSAANAHAAMAASAEGLGGFGDLLGQSGRSGAGTRLAYGAIGGGIDRAAGIQLGSAIAGGGFDARGTTSGLGMLAAAQAGTFGFDGGIGDFNRVNQLKAGQGGLDQIFGGGIDQYQQARNLVGSINRVPGASTYGQDFLANGMTSKQMFDISSGSDKNSDIARAAKGFLGKDYQNIIKGQAEDSFGSVMDRFVDQGGSDNLTKTVKGFRDSGGKDVKKFLRGLNKDDRAALGYFYGQETGSGIEGGVGEINLMAGLGAGTGGIKNGGVGRKVGGVEGQSLDAQAKMLADTNKDILALADAFKAAYKQAPDSVKSLKTYGENLTASADQFIKALTGMTAVMTTELAKMRGEDPASVAKKEAEAKRAIEQIQREIRSSPKY